MKSISHLIIGCLTIFSLNSCKQDVFDYSNTGVLSFEGLSIVVKDLGNTSSPVSDDYIIRLHEVSSEEMVYESTYGETKSLKESEITLNVGEYLLEVSSCETIPDAAFDSAVYGCSMPISIEYGKTTKVEELVCTLLQCAISIDYNEEFLNSVTGNGTASVEILSGQSLKYPLLISDDGTVSFEKRVGYFSMKDVENSTMIITYKGYIDGKRLKMTTTVNEVKAGEYRTITLEKKNSVNDDPRFEFKIEDLISDDDLVNSENE